MIKYNYNNSPYSFKRSSKNKISEIQKIRPSTRFQLQLPEWNTQPKIQTSRQLETNSQSQDQNPNLSKRKQLPLRTIVLKQLGKHNQKNFSRGNSLESNHSGKSVVWDQNNKFPNMVDTSKAEMNDQDKFVLMYKFRYEKDLQQYIPKTKLREQLQKLNIDCKRVSPINFKQNFAFEKDLSNDTNYKQFYKLTVNSQKKNYLPKIEQ